MAKLKRPVLHVLKITRNILRFIRRKGEHYKPEKHYMRGPGPKSREKRVTSIRSGSMVVPL